MSSALVDTDIDRFIREQKSKLASEKHDLNEDDHYFKTSRRQWAEPDKENFMIAGSNERDERAETPAHQGYPVDNRQIIKQRKELSDQRKQEYNNYLKTRTDNRRKPKNLTPTQKSIQVGEYDNEIKERLHNQRKKEYNNYLNKAQLGSPVEYYETNDVYPDNDTSRIAGLPVGQYEENKKRNAEETKRKYRADLEKQLREKEKIIKRQYGVKSKKISREEREKQLRIREEMLRKQLRVQGSPRRSIEKRDRKLYQPMQPQRCTCGYNFPRPDAEERAYLDFIRLRDKYDFRYQDEYDEWQRRQLAALSEIERRQLELRLKLERDLALHYLEQDAMAQFSDEEKDAIRHCPVHIAKCSPCPSRSPSPHVHPPLYDPLEAEILRQSSGTPERLLIGETSTEHREKLRQERQREYNDMMAQKRSRARRNILGDDEDSGWGIFGNRSEDDRKLANQRRDDLLINDKKMGTPRTWREPSKEEILLDDKRENYRKKLEEERKNEYNEHLKKQTQNRYHDLPPKPGTPGGFLNKLGSHEKQRQKLQEERQKEYNRMQAEKLGLHDFEDHRILRGEEPPGAPRKGWGTPTYEEMLEKKRNEEQRYRRLNDPDYSRPGLKAYNSEGALHRLEDEKRLKDIEKDISTKKSVLQNGILDDPGWLRSSHEAEHDRTYSRLLERLKNWNDETQEDDIEKEEPTKETPVNKKASKQDNHLPPHAPVYHDYPPKGIKDAPTYLPDANKHRFYASLPVGEQESQAELQRRKDAYKKELERQMQEAEAARRKNRVVEPPQAEVVKQQQPVQPRVVVIPNVQKQPEVIQAAAQQQYQLATGGDRLSPRAEMLLGRTRDLERLERRLKKIENQQHGISQLDLAELDFVSHRDPRKQMYQPSHETTGILEQGFDRLLDPPKAATIKPPISLAYQPSTYVTGGQNFDKFNSIDQVYHYYGAQNPLDIPVGAPAANYGVAPAVVPSGGVVVDNYRAMGGGGGGRGGGYVSPTMAYNDIRGVGEADPNDDTEAERKAKRAQAQIYQRELERQMEEKKYKKTLEKQEQERYERKLEEDIKNYNPYGRGGAGAPMKDAQGNTVADLRALQKGYSPRYDTGYVDPYISPRGVARAASPKDDLIKTPPAQTTALGEATHARGGHGIFGHPKTEAEKTQADRYKEELKRQIDRKKRDAEMEKEREKREEEKQSKIVEEQRRKMQEEYDEEKRRIMAKEEETRLRNAEIIKMQEDRKTDEERLKEELEKKKRDEARIDYERERLAREYAARTDSPLIPTLRHRTNEVYFDTEPAPRNNSADVLNQLAHMRRQLQSERKRVENMLEETRNEPDVYDPRLVNRVAVPVQPTQQYQKADIFETALNRNAVQVRRAPTADHANPSVLQEFDHLKHKADTDSRKQFRRLYPVDPRTQEELESQQAALLRQQEHRLMGYGHSPSDTDTIGINSTSPQAMLHSNSAFIDVEGMDRNLFPDDFDDFPKRNDSARQRRRDRDQGRSDPEIPRNYNPMGSITSLDVDKISRKNEDRLQRLKELQDDVSLYDPDDVLNRFMEKQSHNRPPSNNTLQDDSWLLPGNKRI